MANEHIWGGQCVAGRHPGLLPHVSEFERPITFPLPGQSLVIITLLIAFIIWSLTMEESHRTGSKPSHVQIEPRSQRSVVPSKLLTVTHSCKMNLLIHKSFRVTLVLNAKDTKRDERSRSDEPSPLWMGSSLPFIRTFCISNFFFVFKPYQYFFL